jgi:hypothetical protein
MLCLQKAVLQQQWPPLHSVSGHADGIVALHCKGTKLTAMAGTGLESNSAIGP